MNYLFKRLIKIISKKIRISFNKNLLVLKPNFLIAGACRSSTTTLYSYLKQHPEIFCSEWKEPNFFSLNYNLGQRWYLRNFISRKKYKAVGEATVLYFIWRKAPERIYRFDPDIKLIFLLRNPVERLYSQYKRHVQWTGWSESFESLLNKYFYSFTSHGNYYSNISRFMQFIPKENIFIGISEEFNKYTEKILKKICIFLGVNPNFKFNHNKIDINSSKIPMSFKLQKFCGKYFNYWPKDNKINKFLGLGGWIFINWLNHRANRWILPEINEKTRNFLRNYYYDEIIKLEDLIGRELDIWKS